MGEVDKGGEKKKKHRHGRTRNYTEKTEAETRKRQKKSHGRKAHLTEPEA